MFVSPYSISTMRRSCCTATWSHVMLSSKETLRPSRSAMSVCLCSWTRTWEVTSVFMSFMIKISQEALMRKCSIVLCVMGGGRDGWSTESLPQCPVYTQQLINNKLWLVLYVLERVSVADIHRWTGVIWLLILFLCLHFQVTQSYF